MSRRLSDPTLRIDRAVLIGSAGLIGALAWLALFLHGEHAEVSHALSPHAAPSGPAGLAISFGMWTTMMIGMMLPVVMPWILGLAAVSRDRMRWSTPWLSAGGFAAGYFAIWSAYSLLAAWLQLALQRMGHLGHELSVGTVVGGGLLIMAGVFQLSPLKEACLVHCRSPIGFFLSRWRDGPRGAFGMGFEHGLYCVGCCWALMALMFVTGLMNLLWMAVLAVMMLAEQITPRRIRLSVGFGIALMVWGAALIARVVWR